MENETMVPSNENEYTTLDLYIGAFLQLKGMQGTMRFAKNGKAALVFQRTPHLDDELTAYNSLGAVVPALKFAREVKTLRGQIYKYRESMGVGAGHNPHKEVIIDG